MCNCALCPLEANDVIYCLELTTELSLVIKPSWMMERFLETPLGDTGAIGVIYRKCSGDQPILNVDDAVLRCT